MRTEIALASGATPEMLEAFKDAPMLDSADVSQAVVYVLGTKPHVQVIDNAKLVTISISFVNSVSICFIRCTS